MRYSHKTNRSTQISKKYADNLHSFDSYLRKSNNKTKFVIERFECLFYYYIFYSDSCVLCVSVKLCVPHSVNEACLQMVEQGKSVGVNMACVPARDRSV